MRTAPRIVRLSLCLSTALTAACVVGAPNGFSSGTNWSIPLLGALEDGPMITPVKINGHGPYLFTINPHSRSIVDPRVAKDADLYVERAWNDRLTNSDDHISHEKVDYAEGLTIELGDLTVEKRDFYVLPSPATYHGQPVLGTIGRDFIDETLIWTIDRDRQMLYLATQGHAQPPPDAMKFKADRIFHSYFFIEPEINGKKVYAYMDLGHPVSALWPHIIEKLGLKPMAGETVTDFFGRRYSYSSGFNADRIELGDASTRNLIVAPYKDARTRKRDLDGYLGRDFFSRYWVMVNWHEKTVWLEARSSDVNRDVRDRLSRWGTRFMACKSPACVEASIEKAESGLPAVRVEREASAAAVGYEVVFEAVDDANKPLPLPKLLAAFPAGTTDAELPSADCSRYFGASGLRVVDVTPFPPACNNPTAGHGCMGVLTD